MLLKRLVPLRQAEQSEAVVQVEQLVRQASQFPLLLKDPDGQVESHWLLKKTPPEMQVEQLVLVPEH